MSQTIAKYSRLSAFAFLSLFMLHNVFGQQSSTCTPGSVNNANSAPWSPECYLNNSCNEQGNPCTANDVNLINAFIADINGNPINAFAPGTMIEVYLWGTFSNGTNSTRYAIRTSTELWIDGLFVEQVNTCSFDQMAPGESDALLVGPLMLESGQQFELVYTWIGWETSSAQCTDPSGANFNSTCGQYAPSKCSKTLGAIQVLIPNFNFSCGESAENETLICFQNNTSGGEPPITYLWEFGDGNTSTVENPCHTYLTTTGIFEVTLTATDADSNSATTALTIDLDELECPEPELTLEKTADPQTFTEAGQVISYTIEVENTGNVVISDLLVTDPLADSPPVFVSGDDNDNGVLDPGETWVYEASYTITESDMLLGEFTNTATADGTPNGGVLMPASDQATVNFIGLNVSKSASESVYTEEGQEITYTIIVENTGNVEITDIDVEDDLTGDDWNILSLLPGASQQFTTIYAITNADLVNGTVINTVIASGSGPDDEEVSAEGTETITAVRADLAITKTGQPNPVLAGDVLTYTISVSNLGDDTAQNVVVEDIVPASLFSPTFSIDNGLTWESWTGSFDHGTLASGQSFSILLQVTVDPNYLSEDPIENTATVDSDTFDPVPGNNSSTSVTDVETEADLVILKEASAEPVVAGTEIIYTITVTNDGPSAAQAVQVADNVPAGILSVTFSDNEGLSWSPWSSPYVYGTLEAGKSFSFQIRGMVNPALAEGSQLSNTAIVSSTTPDPNTGNNTSTVLTNVIREADLSVIKRQIGPESLPDITPIDPSRATPGNRIYYLLTVENFGPSYATNAVVTDNLPTGISNEEFSLNFGNSWADWDGTRPLVNFEFPGINQILIRGDIDPGLTGNITNTATISSDTTDPNPDNNEDSVTTELEPLADIAVIKEVFSGAVSLNQEIIYRLTIDNFGPSTATDIIVEDIIDTSLISGPEYSLDQSSWTAWPTSNQVNVGDLEPFAPEITLFIRGTLIAGIPDPEEDDVLKVPNTATVTSSVDDPDPDNNTSSIITTLDVEADLELVKTGSATVIAGNPITYTLTITNLSTEFASEGVIVEDVINTNVIASPEYSFDEVDWLP